MADSASTKTTSLITSLPEFTLDVYTNIPSAELVVFTVYSLQSDGLPVATEEIVSACFRLFPHRFSLKNYFYWPDSALIASFLHEAKEKGDLKGKPADGFAVKVQGRQTVKRVAKALGVTLPAPEIKKVEPIQPAKPKAKKKAAVPQEKKSPTPAVKKKKAVIPQEKKPVQPLVKEILVKKQTAASVKKKLAAPAKKKAKDLPGKKSAVTAPAKKQTAKPLKKILAKKTPPKLEAPAKVKILPKSAPVKQELLPKIKVEPKKKKQAKPIKKISAPRKEKPQKQVPVKNAQPAQLTLALPMAEEKKAKPTPPVVKKATAPTAAIHVSREEKVKAGRVVRVMENSDAYRQYKRHGDKSKISEFDFRSLLLCTMESSPETLARNINTFKGYANIQNRQDLVTFLNFVEHSFSTLLHSSGKKLAKKR